MTHEGSTAPLYRIPRIIVDVCCTCDAITRSEQVNFGAILRVEPFFVLWRRCTNPNNALEMDRVGGSEPVLRSELFQPPVCDQGLVGISRSQLIVIIRYHHESANEMWVYHHMNSLFDKLKFEEMAPIMKIATCREGPGSYLDYGASRPLRVGNELIRYIQYGRRCNPRHCCRTKVECLSREMITMRCVLKTHSQSLGDSINQDSISLGNLGR